MHLFNALSVVVVLCSLALLPLVTCQQTLSFGQITVVSCPGGLFPVPVQLTLTTPAWPATPAQHFVITIFQGYFINGLSITAGLSPNVTQWSQLNDQSIASDHGELWIPAQPEGTTVYVNFGCSYSAGNYTLEPVIPVAPAATNIAGFNMSSFSDAHSHWFAISQSSPYVWAELCSVPSNYLFYMHVVFPGTNASQSSCQSEGNTYLLTPGVNFFQYATSSISVNWNSFSGGIAYVFAYTRDITSNSIQAVPTNLYATTVAGAAIEYWGVASGRFESQGLQLGNNLFIMGEGGYFPTDTSQMQLYYVDTSSTAPKTTLNPSFFNSACYLKTQAQSALVSGGLKNFTQDNQLLLSDVGILKADNFYKSRNVVSGKWGITYGNYIALPPFTNSPKVSLPDNSWMIGVMAGLGAFSGIMIIVAIVLVLQLRRAGYKHIH